METLHIYAQEIWHDAAYIAGTSDALRALRDAIERALTNNAPAIAEAFCRDGEGYRVNVLLVSEEDINRMCVPYTDEIAKAPSGNGFGPWTLLRNNSGTQE